MIDLEVSMIILDKPKNGEVINLQKKYQARFIAGNHTRTSGCDENDEDWFDAQSEVDDGTRPLPVRFEWQGEGFVLELSTSADMKNAKEYAVCVNSVELYNLPVGKSYYWRVRGEEVSEVRRFYILDRTPRTLYVDGVWNMRDLGGYKADGGRVKYGMLYRGAAFEDLADKRFEITPEGVKAIMDIGLRTEVDFRVEAPEERELTKEVMKDSGVNRLGCDCEMYDKIFTRQEFRESQAEFIRLLTREETYPLFFHCYAGADRTGTFAYIIGSILGVDEKNLIDDYEFTTLCPHGSRGRNSDEWKAFMAQLAKYDGESNQERVVNALKEYFGITEEELQRIRDILIEKI